MEEGSNVRLVRCPKCQNLLSELPDFSLYQCGGCGAVLRAKKKGPLGDHLSEKSDEEMSGGGGEKGLGVSLESSFESESDGLEHSRKQERNFSKRTTNLTKRSSSLTDHGESVNHFDEDSTRREPVNSRVEQSNEDAEAGYFSDRYTQCSKRSDTHGDHRIGHAEKGSFKRPESGSSYVENEVKEIKTPIGDFAGSLRSRPVMDQWCGERNESGAFYGIGRGGNDREASIKGFESGNSCVQNEVKEIKPPIGDFAGSLRSMPGMDQWSVDRNGEGAFYGNRKGVEERRRFSTSPYPDEGPSNYWPGSFQGCAEHKRIHHDLEWPSGVENLRHDRAELLRKLDELTDQLSRSRDVMEKPRERVPVDRTAAPPPPPPPPTNRYCGPGFYMPEGPTSLYSVNVQPFPQDKHFPDPLYCNQSNGPVPYINGRVLDMQEPYPPPRKVTNECLGYEQSYLPQRLRRPPRQLPPEYFKQPFHDHFAGHTMGFNRSTLASHQNETFSHQPACSCLQCCRIWQIPPNVPRPTVSSRSTTDRVNPSFHHVASSVSYGRQGYSSRGSNPPPLNSLTRQPQTKSSTEFDLDTGGLGLRCPRRMVVANGSERVCHPIAGGAPFLACYSCFELLKLPRKLLATRKNQQKVRCGACSAFILIELEKKGIVVKIPRQLKKVSPEVGDGCGSDDFDNSVYDFELTDSEPNDLSTGQMLNFGESNERQDPLSSSSSFSEDENSPDSVISQREVSNPADVPIPLPDSLQQKDPGNAASNHVVSRNGMGNKSKRDVQEKLNLDKSTSRQNSVKEVSMATEMEVSCNEFPNGSMYQDSVEESKEDRHRINKGSDSFFAGLIKKRFRDFSRSSQSVEKGRSNVFVNGQSIPDRVVKKAAKLAGPIQPGSYWYDYRAGFWGVMGQPCSGIIPPFIEEFNYPMPQNCAAGNTGVFVNGRELHQKDLDLLSGRGLRTERDKSYIIEICGRILDEDTGEELDSLGKLAPTVEKAKHGFGMKVPRPLLAE